MRLIDADALIVAMLDHGVDHVQTDDLEEINQIINDAPTVDAVPVVRCINCRHGWAFFDASMPGGSYVLCGKPYAAPRETHKFDYFCADGKPKEDTP